MATLLEYCPVCTGTHHRFLYPVAEGKLVLCHTCDLVFFTPRPSFADLAAFYDAIEYREGYSASAMADLAFAQARYQHLHQMITRYAPAVFNKENRHLLDVGCGRGDLLRVAQAVGWEITGIELSPLAVQQANALLGNSHVKEGDLQSLVLPQGTYSVVTSYHVIEHLLDPVANLVALRQLLQPGGIAFIETPNIDSLGARVRGKRWSHIIPPEHINYFNPDSLSYALKQSGFERYQVFTSTPPLIESIQDWPPILKAIATQVYNLAPQFNLGAALQAIAFQD